jgi:hypothetical protein
VPFLLVFKDACLYWPQKPWRGDRWIQLHCGTLNTPGSALQAKGHPEPISVTAVEEYRPVSPTTHVTRYQCYAPFRVSRWKLATCFQVFKAAHARTAPRSPTAPSGSCSCTKVLSAPSTTSPCVSDLPRIHLVRRMDVRVVVPAHTMQRSMYIAL